MDEELLNNIYEHLSTNKLTDSDYNSWKNNFSRSGEVQSNVYKYLREKNLTSSSMNDWKMNIGLKKKDVSQPVGPKTAKVSTTSVGKKSLLDTVGQKKEAVSVSSNGKSKIPAGELSRLKGEFKASVENKPKTTKQKIQEEEMGLLTKPKSSIGVTKVKQPITIEQVNQGNEIVKELVNREIPRYREETKLTDEEKAETEIELENKINKTGFWNGLNAGISKWSNLLSTGSFEVEDPLLSEKNQAKEEFKESKVKATPQQLEERAKEIFIDNKNTEKKQQKINKFLGELDENTKDYLEVNADKRLSTLSQEKKDLTNRIKLNEQYGLKLIEDIKSSNISEEERLQKQNELIKISKYLREDYNKSTKNSEDLGTAKEEFDSFRKNYNSIDNVTGRFRIAFNDLLLGVASYGSQAESYMNPMTAASNVSTQFKIKELREENDLFRDTLRPDNKELTLDNFLQYSGDVISSNGPTFATIAATGGAGAAILGFGEAGKMHNDMFVDSMSGKKVYSPYQMVFAPLVSGISTAVLSESPTIKTLRNAKNVFKAAASTTAGKESINLATKRVSDNLFKTVLKEDATELADNVAQNMVKKDILGDDSVDYFDNSAKVLKDTTLMTSIMGGAPHVTLSAVKKFSNAKESAKLNFNGLKIKEYLEKLDDPNVTEETKKIIKSEIDKLTIESSNLVNDKIEKISKMPEDDINKVLDNSKRISDIIVEVDVVKEDDSLSVEQKQAMLDNMKQETSNLIKENEDLSSKENKEENPYYYNTDPNRGEVEQKPSVVPEGYTTVKEVQNGFELDAWKKQKEVVGTDNISDTKKPVSKSLSKTKEDVIKVSKSPDFMNDAEHIVTLNNKEVGRMYYDRGSKSWRDPNFDRSKYSLESFERVYGDILGDTKQESIDELVRRKKESKVEKDINKEAVSKELPIEDKKLIKFSNDKIINNFLNKLNKLNPIQVNPINNKSFIYGDKASLEFNRFDKGDRNEISLEGISSLNKGKGLGKESMNDITKSADELGITITLDAKPFGRDGLGKESLINFYKKNGFIVDKQYLEDLEFDSEKSAIDYVLENESEALPMVRNPKQIDVTSKRKENKNLTALEIELSDKEGKLSRSRSESRKATLQSEIDGIKSEIEKLSEKPAEEIKKEEVSLQDIEEVNEDNFNDVIKNLKERGLIENPCK